MAGRAFDYSKWDNIELSDDESDLHPNIDKDSWFRLKHRTRLEREEREDKEVAEYQQKNKEDQARINILKTKIDKAKAVQSNTSSNADEEDDAAFEDIEALQIEVDELKEQIAKRNRRIEEINNKRQWNIDNICKVKEEKTIVNSAEAKPLKAEASLVEEEEVAIPSSSSAAANTPPPVPAAAVAAAPVTTTAKSAATASTTVAAATQPPAAPVNKGIEPAATIKRDRMAVINYNDFAIKHERILETYSDLEDLEKTKDYLFKNCDILLHEHAQSYMLLSSLEDEMNGKHKRMKLVCRQCQILTHIHELGVSMKRDPRDVILPFFKRIEEATYLQGFLGAVDDFIKKIQKRAVEKRKEMDAEKVAKKNTGDDSDEEDGVEYEAVGDSPVGPGGLNPLEVLKQLPKPMRKAFESQDIGRLQEVLGAMAPDEAKHWMKLCVDSGLWVAKDPTVFEGEEDEAGGNGDIDDDVDA